MINGIQRISDTVDLIESPDDNGYYFEEYAYDGKGTTRHSQVFKYIAESIVAFENKKVKWGKWS